MTKFKMAKKELKLLEARIARLPLKKPSRLIRLALRDMIKLEHNACYQIEMGCWHEPRRDGVCEICFAGSLLAGRCKMPSNCNVIWSNDSVCKLVFGSRARGRFFALNSLRMGNIAAALHELDIKRPVGLPDTRHVTPYSIHPESFKADMGAIAKLLEKHGL